MIKTAFVSNYYNHHQSDFSEAMSKMTDVEYYFIETMPMTDERKKMGWGIEEKPDYILAAYESNDIRKKCMQIIDDSDFVIIGSADDEYIRNRHKKGKFVFRYSERFYKTGCPKWQIPARFIKNYYRFNRYQNDYLLCASAFTAADAAITRSFMGKSYKWGYFPPVRKTKLDRLFELKKSENSLSILWVGRFLEWKHPDISIRMAERLKKEHIHFLLNIIGSGEQEKYLRSLILEKGLSDCVHMLGAKKPDEVREYMDRSDIFLFTSDFNEGWGAVLNEAMNSACAVIVSHAIGSVPFLVKHLNNGIVYHNGDFEDFYRAVYSLVEDSELMERIGRAAYFSIIDEWNAETAANRLLALYRDLRENGRSTSFLDGPCSVASILKNEWF